MSSISEHTTKFFKPRGITDVDDILGVTGTLDVALLHSAEMVEAIYELALFPHAGVDGDAIAAQALSLLAYLGTMGPLIDEIDGYTIAEMARRKSKAGSGL